MEDKESDRKDVVGDLIPLDSTDTTISPPITKDSFWTKLLEKMAEKNKDAWFIGGSGPNDKNQQLSNMTIRLVSKKKRKDPRDKPKTLKEFRVHKLVLINRSDIFNILPWTGMKESQYGIVEITDRMGILEEGTDDSSQSLTNFNIEETKVDVSSGSSSGLDPTEKSARRKEEKKSARKEEEKKLVFEWELLLHYMYAPGDFVRNVISCVEEMCHDEISGSIMMFGPANFEPEIERCLLDEQTKVQKQIVYERNVIKTITFTSFIEDCIYTADVVLMVGRSYLVKDVDSTIVELFVNLLDLLTDRIQKYFPTTDGFLLNYPWKLVWKINSIVNRLGLLWSNECSNTHKLREILINLMGSSLMEGRYEGPFYLSDLSDEGHCGAEDLLKQMGTKFRKIADVAIKMERQAHRMGHDGSILLKNLLNLCKELYETVPVLFPDNGPMVPIVPKEKNEKRKEPDRPIPMFTVGAKKTKSSSSVFGK